MAGQDLEVRSRDHPLRVVHVAKVAPPCDHHRLSLRYRYRVVISKRVSGRVQVANPFMVVEYPRTHVADEQPVRCGGLVRRLLVPLGARFLIHVSHLRRPALNLRYTRRLLCPVLSGCPVTMSP